MEPDKLIVALETNGQGDIRVLNRHSIPVNDSHRTVIWLVPSLVELFRGNKMPPRLISATIRRITSRTSSPSKIISPPCTSAPASPRQIRLPISLCRRPGP